MNSDLFMINNYAQSGWFNVQDLSTTYTGRSSTYTGRSSRATLKSSLNSATSWKPNVSVGIIRLGKMNNTDMEPKKESQGVTPAVSEGGSVIPPRPPPDPRDDIDINIEGKETGCPANSNRVYPMANCAQSSHQNGILVNIPARTSRMSSYPKRQVVCIGSLQIVCGVVSILLAIRGALNETPQFLLGCGFWCGILAIVAGVVGVVAGVKANKCMNAAHMIVSIVAAAVGEFQVYIAILFPLGTYIDPAPDYMDGLDNTTSLMFGPPQEYPDLNIHLNIALAVVGCLGCIVSIWAASIGCHFGCSKGCADCCCPCYSPKELRGETQDVMWVELPVNRNQEI